MRLSEGPLAEGLQLFALFGLAVAAPLLDLVGRHPGFLVANGLAGTRLAALVAGLLLLPAVRLFSDARIVLDAPELAFENREDVRLHPFRTLEAARRVEIWGRRR